MLNYHGYVSTYSGDEHYQSFYAWTVFFLSRILSIGHCRELLILCLRFCNRFFVVLPVSLCLYYSLFIPSVSPMFCSHLTCVLHDLT